MTQTQWVAELESLSILDQRKYDDIKALFKVGRRTLIDLLGLNLMPIDASYEDEHGNLIERLRRPEDHEVMPLALICGNESMLSEVAKKNNEYLQQSEVEEKAEKGEYVEMSPEELDEFMSEGDIEFIEDPFEKKRRLYFEENQAILGSLVKSMDEKDSDIEDKSEPPKKRSRVKVNK